MANRALRDNFLQFVTNQRTDEDVLLWMAIDDYRRKSSGAQYIWKYFLEPKAEHEIALDP